MEKILMTEKQIEQFLDEVDAFCATAAPPDYDPDRVGDVPTREFIKDAQVYLPRLSRELRRRLEREQMTEQSNRDQAEEIAEKWDGRTGPLADRITSALDEAIAQTWARAIEIVSGIQLDWVGEPAQALDECLKAMQLEKKSSEVPDIFADQPAKETQ